MRVDERRRTTDDEKIRARATLAEGGGSGGDRTRGRNELVCWQAGWMAGWLAMA